MYLFGLWMLALLLIFMNAFFVAAEFSLITASRAFLNEKSDAEGRQGAQARLALKVASNLPKYLMGAQLGITMSTLALGYLAEPAVATTFELVPPVSNAVAAVLALVFVTFTQMVLGEIVPKNWALSEPERTALTLSKPHNWFVGIFTPAVWILDKMTAAGVRLLGVSPNDHETQARTPAELFGVVQESLEEGVIGEFERDLLTGALDLGEVTAISHSVPFSEIVFVLPDMLVREVEEIALSSGHSRLPVFGPNNETMGFVHTKDLFSVPIEDSHKVLPKELVRPILRVQANMAMDDVLLQMKESRRHLALVMDGNIDILGLITIEDVLESLVGDFPED